MGIKTTQKFNDQQKLALRKHLKGMLSKPMEICLSYMENTAGLRPSDWKEELQSQSTKSSK